MNNIVALYGREQSVFKTKTYLLAPFELFDLLKGQQGVLRAGGAALTFAVAIFAFYWMTTLAGIVTGTLWVSVHMGWGKGLAFLLGMLFSKVFRFIVGYLAAGFICKLGLEVFRKKPLKPMASQQNLKESA